MSKEICISSTPHETRLAILEDEQLTEVYYERENEYTLAGSIYKGRVTRVLPGMQSAFVDLGLERDAFLYVTDFMEEQEDSSDFERIPGSGEDAARPREPREQREPREPREQQNRQPRAAATEEESTPRRNGAPAGSQGSASGGQAPGGEFEDGTRRWRGRRGRRKGLRDRKCVV
jgi:ribonuclease E